MIVQPDVHIKELSAATAGELVRFDLRRASALAIVMRQTGQSTVCAFLETNDEARAPFFMAMSIEGLVCMSYGKGWLLDLAIDANTFPGNSEYSDKHGIIYVGENYNGHQSKSSSRQHSVECWSFFDLMTFKSVDVHRRTCAPVMSWKIWHTAAAKYEPNAKPLFVFAFS